MILLLNADYTPLSIINLKRAYKLLFKSKANIVETDTSRFINNDKRYLRPSVIRLSKYVSTPYKELPLTRQNLFRRDGHQCCYCSSKKDLTIDHVIPRSKGGKNTWKNLVTCCKKCNKEKDDKSLEDSGLVLRHNPTTPSYISLLITTNQHKEDWKKYIFF
jgi:5-methylcytosine-specific restriction endonuclease McrA